jgi:tetratricopeptide (TPR) repeat protein
MKSNKNFFAFFFSIVTIGLILTALPVVAQSNVVRDASREFTALELHDQAMMLAATAWDKMENQKLEVLQEAIILLNQAIEKDATFASAYTNRGTFYLHIGDFDLALANYDQSIAIQPTAVAYKNKAHAFELQGQLATALENYEKALSSFGISTETFVNATSDINTLKDALTDPELAGKDLLYTPGVVLTIEKVYVLRRQLGFPIDSELSLPEHLQQNEENEGGNL